MIRRKKTRARSRTARDVASPWGNSSRPKIERLLIEASERIVKADSAMGGALPELRKDQRGRVKANIGYLHRLLTEALRYVGKANDEIGF